MNFNRIKGKVLAAFQIILTRAQPSFSQAGEDLIIRFLFHALRIQMPTYLDIGTNHPMITNNTFFFYNRGSKGVCIEPDMRFAKLIKAKRPKDVLLEVGVGVSTEDSADFFIFPEKYSQWNTFVQKEAENRFEETNVPFQVSKMPLMNVNNVIEKYFDSCPNYISIDVEGLDFEILKSLDFTKHKPEVICVETVSFSLNNEKNKLNEIIEYVLSKGYFVFADTYCNTIFCNKVAFEKTNKSIS